MDIIGGFVPVVSVVVNINWTAIGAIGTCVGAFATFGACVISLWQVLRGTIGKIRFECDINQIREGIPVIKINCTNVCRKTLYIRDIALKVGKEYMKFTKIPNIKLPKELHPGEEFECLFQKEIACTVGSKFEKNKTVYITASDTFGKVFKKKCDFKFGDLFE